MTRLRPVRCLGCARWAILLRREPFRNWGCVHCDAHGPAASDEEGWRLAQEHARGCAGYAKASHNEDVRRAAPEMLALLRELEWYLEGHVCPRCGGTRPNHLDLCRLAALLARLSPGAQ